MDVQWRRDVDVLRRQPGTSEPLFVASERDVEEAQVYTTEEWVDCDGKKKRPLSRATLRAAEEDLQAGGYIRCLTPDGEPAWLLVLNRYIPNPQIRWSM